MAEPKKVKIIAARAFLHEGKRVEPGSIIEVSEYAASDIAGTKRGLEATNENVKAVKEALKNDEAAKKAAAEKK